MSAELEALRAIMFAWQDRGFLFVSQRTADGVDYEVLMPDGQKQTVTGKTEDEALTRALRRASIWGTVRQLGR